MAKARGVKAGATGEMPRMVGESERDSAPAANEVSGQIVTTLLADVEAKRVNWLWPGRVARGKVTLTAGHPGIGKSHQSMDLVARVTTGRLWPDGAKCTAGDVLIFSAEDDPADTIRPRLEAAEADLTRVHFVTGVITGYADNGSKRERVFSLELDLPALESKLTELPSIVAVVIDPITAYLGKTDSHKNAEVRGLLAPLADLAARHDVAILAITHLNKSASGASALMRVIDSVAFTGLARAAFLVARDPKDPTRLLFLPMKSNIGPTLEGLAFRIESATVASKIGPIQTSRLVWESGSVSLTADEALTPGPQLDSAIGAAKEWLRNALANGAVASKQLFADAKSCMISEITLRRALSEIKAVSGSTGFRGSWTWSLES